MPFHAGNLAPQGDTFNDSNSDLIRSTPSLDVGWNTVVARRDLSFCFKHFPLP